MWTIATDGGSLRRMTQGPEDEHLPSFSRDGHWIYFTREQGGRGSRDIWRIPAAGGTAERLTREGGTFARESFDGRLLFYQRGPYDAPSPLLARPVGGGPEREIVHCVHTWGFAVTAVGIFYADCPSGQGGEPSLHSLELATGRDHVLGTLELATGRGHVLGTLEGYSYLTGLAVSPDGRTILFSKWVSRGADLMMIENFR
jgi:Tol biopolymer transport system component